MKKLFFFILLFCGFNLNAQINQDDLTLVRGYMDSLRSFSIFEAEQYSSLIKKSLDILEGSEQYDLLTELYGRKSLITIYSPDFDQAQATADADRSIALAYHELGDSLHPLSRWAYLLKINTATSIEEKARLAKITRQISPSGYIKHEAIRNHMAVARGISNTTLIDSLIHEAEKLATSVPDAVRFKYVALPTEGKMLRAQIVSDHEQAIYYGKLMLEQIQDNDLFNASYPQAIMYYISISYTWLEKADDAIIWAQKGIDEGFSERTALCMHAMGSAQRKKGNLEAACEWLEKSLALLQKREIVDENGLEIIVKDLATTYSQIGNIDDALRVAAIPLNRNPNVNGLTSYAFQLRNAGKRQEALEYLQRAIVMGFGGFESTDVNSIPNDEHQLVNAEALTSLVLKGWFMGELAEQTGQNDLLAGGIASIRFALDYIKGTQINTPGLHSAELVAQNFLFYNGNGELLKILGQQYGVKQDEKSLRDFLLTSEKLKAQNLTHSLVQPSLPEEVINESQALEQKRAAIQQQLDLATNDTDRKKLRNQLLEQVELIKAYTKNISANYAREQDYFYNVSYTDFKEVEQTLAENELMLSYAIYGKNSILFSVATDKAGSQLKQVRLTPEFAAMIIEYQKLIRSPLLRQKTKKDRFIALGKQLYDLLVAPHTNKIQGKQKLLIVPDRSLNTLPFESLVKSGEQDDFSQMDFLIKDYAISYYPSATVYLQLKQKTVINDGSVLAFAPVFDDASGQNIAQLRAGFVQDTVTRAGIDENGFTPLPASRKEVKTIFSLLQSSKHRTILLDKEANKTQVSQALKHPLQFIHLATHGLVNYETPRLSALACYPASEKASTLLFANEIQFLPLQADLVVMSSCDSGLGDSALGEGILSLNRTFLYAGARNVISSLWKVSDRYSSQLMIDFYQYQQAQQDKTVYSDALRQAKLKMLQDPKSSLPRYWAPFVLVGE